MTETGVSRAQIISELQKSRHGKLTEYLPIIGKACELDPEFVAHLIAWDFTNGQIKDSKIALPVITLASTAFPAVLKDNSLAHLAMQPPRELLKALKFAIEIKAPNATHRTIRSMIHRYLAAKEAVPGKWMHMAARHRRSLKSLYSLSHARTPDWVSAPLFKGVYPPGSIFSDIANLHNMAPTQAAATIQKWHLSPLVVCGAMAGSKAQNDAAVVQAGMDQMSDTELINRAASLEKQGVARDPGLKEGFRKRVGKAVKSGKATLKTSVAAEEVEDDGLRVMLRELQERQIAAQKDAGRGLVGNWLVIVDRSQSQQVAIKLGTHVGASLAKFVTGQVHLVFCNSEVIPYDVTGMRLEDIVAKTQFIIAGGSTSYGVGLEWAQSKNLDISGVVVVGDGGENSAPLMVQAWQEWKRKNDQALPIYFLQTFCPPEYARMPNANPRLFEALMERATIPVVKHDCTKDIDFYSIPNIVQTFSASRFGVVEKIMACPLVTLDMALGLAPAGVLAHA